MSAAKFQHLIKVLLKSVNGSYWRNILYPLLSNEKRNYAVHLGIFVDPYLTYILERIKTIESRFSINRIPPFDTIKKGDIILLKRSGGPVVGLCNVSEVSFYQLNSTTWKTIRKQAKGLCILDENFWEAKKNASFATIMRLNHVHRIIPFQWEKQDRRGLGGLTRKTKNVLNELNIYDFSFSENLCKIDIFLK